MATVGGSESFPHSVRLGEQSPAFPTLKVHRPTLHVCSHLLSDHPGRNTQRARAHRVSGLRGESLRAQLRNLQAGGRQSDCPGQGANLDDVRHMQLGGLQAKTGIDATKQQDGENNGEVSHQGPDLRSGEEGVSVVGRPGLTAWIGDLGDSHQLFISLGLSFLSCTVEMMWHHLGGTSGR